MRKEIKKITLVAGLVLAMGLTGCSKDNEKENETEVSVSEGVLDNEDNKDTEKQESTEETDAVTTDKVDVEFDTEFVVKTGDTICVGRDGITITIDGMFYEEAYEVSFVDYTLKIDGKTYIGDGTCLAGEEGAVSQDTFTFNRVVLLSMDKDQSATMMITSETKIKEPLILSGNPEDVYEITEASYVESESFYLFLCEGSKVYGNTAELIEKTIDIVEEEVGLKLYNDSTFMDQPGRDLSSLYGEETFAGVDPEIEKFHIYVVPADVFSPSSLTYAVVLNPIDMELENGEYALTHELVHAIHHRNGVSLDRIMDEGFATYITSKIARERNDIYLDFDGDICYGGYPIEITPENAETEFLKQQEDSWTYYLYGYKFVNFIHDTYGEDVFLNIIEDANAVADVYMVSGETLVEIIKENTSEDVFEKFGAAY